jgi:hypothetical protein
VRSAVDEVTHVQGLFSLLHATPASRQMATGTIAPAFTTGEGETEETVQQKKKNRIDKAASPDHGGIGIPEDGEA